MANRRHFLDPLDGSRPVPLPQARIEEDLLVRSGSHFVPYTPHEDTPHSHREISQFDNTFVSPQLLSTGNARTYSDHRSQISQPPFQANWRSQSAGGPPAFQDIPNLDLANGYHSRLPADNMTSSGTDILFGATAVPRQRSSIPSFPSNDNSSGPNHTGGSSSPYSIYHPSNRPEIAPNMTIPISSTRSGSFLAPRDNSNRVGKKWKAKGYGAGCVPGMRKQLPKNASKLSEIRKTKRLNSDVLTACDAWIQKNQGKYPRDKVIHRLGGRYHAPTRTLRKYFDRTLLKTASHQHAPVSSDHELVSCYRSNWNKCKADPDWLTSLERKPDRQFVCTRRCGLTFATRKQWIKHEETNWVQHIWKCRSPGCQPLRPSTRKDHFQTHLKTFHDNEHGTKQDLEDSHIPITNNFPKACIFHDCGATFESWKNRNKHVGDHLRSDWNASQWRKPEGDTVGRKVINGRTEEASGDVDEEESNSSQSENGSTSTTADYGSTNGSDDEANDPDDNPDAPGPNNGDNSGDDMYKDQNPDPQPSYGPGGIFDPNTGSFFGFWNHLSRQKLRLAPDRESASKPVSANRATLSLSTHARAIGRRESKEEMREYIIEKYFREYSVFKTPSRTVQREQGLMADFITAKDDILRLSSLKISEAPIITCGA